MTLKELREKLAAKQNELAKVFEEAKTDDGEYDYTRVKCLGVEDGPQKSITVAEKVGAMDAELNELAEKAEKLEAAEQAAKNQAAREQAVKRPPFPVGDRGNHPSVSERLKSLGEMIAEQKDYQDWAKRGAPGGIDFQFDDMLPSDMLAKGMAFDTLRSKALFETGAGWAPESIRLPGFVEAPTRPLQIIDIIPMAETGMEQIVYMEETTRTHAAAETAEGGTFAESTFALTERSSPVRKTTDSVPVSDEQLEDVPMAQSYLNGRLTFGLRQRLDSQIQVGDATGSNLRGIKNTVGIQTQAKGADPIPDAYFKAMTKVRVTGRATPTHHIIHPTNWESVRLLRTADGIYIWGNPSEAGPERLWGLPLVQSDAEAAGTGYVGSFLPPWISLFEKRGIDIQIGYVGTQFVEGKRTIRGDMRHALVLFRPAAFSSVTGLNG